jgi:hypothetical protein
MVYHWLCLGCLLTHDPPASTSQVAKITRMCHYNFFFNFSYCLLTVQTDGFHYDTSIYVYNALWSYSPLYYPFLSPSPIFFSLSRSLKSLFYYHVLFFPPKSHIWIENIQSLSLWEWLISLNMMILSFIHFPTNGIIFLYGWIKLHCLYVSHFLYPFIHRQASRLIP